VTSSPSSQPPVPEHARLDLHNASVNESAAALGHCGMTDLHNGRVCHGPAAHVGGCDFGPAPAHPPIAASPRRS
jgi:hypothetical protein